MPFDAPLDNLEIMPAPVMVPSAARIDPPKSGNSLAAFGIHSVPRDIAEAHKEEMIERFRRTDPRGDYMITAGLAHWSKRWINNPIDPLNGAKVNWSTAKLTRRVRRVLSNPAGNSTPDRSVAPEAIIKVAETVCKKIEDPIFVIEYFYDDPILNVSYMDDDGVQHHDCLGIWDNGNVVAIATVPPEASLVSRMMGWLFRR